VAGRLNPLPDMCRDVGPWLPVWLPASRGHAVFDE